MKMDLMADFRISRVGTSVSASTTSAVSISLYRSLWGRKKFYSLQYSDFN